MIKTQRNDKLKALRAAANEAIGLIDPTDIRGPVNWADLRCTEARQVLTDAGETRYEVLIEEADPAADRLQEAVEKYLTNHGWPGVGVVTEW